jgi:hypothetical protein
VTRFFPPPKIFLFTNVFSVQQRKMFVFLVFFLNLTESGDPLPGRDPAVEKRCSRTSTTKKSTFITSTGEKIDWQKDRLVKTSIYLK